MVMVAPSSGVGGQRQGGGSDGPVVTVGDAGALTGMWGLLSSLGRSSCLS